MSVDHGKTTETPMSREIESLEAEKLRLEIAGLRRLFLFRSNFWLAALPTILALAGAYQVYNSEIFNVMSERLALRNETLALKTENLTFKENALRTSIAEAETEFKKRSAQYLEQERLLKETYDLSAAALEEESQALQRDFELEKAKLETERGNLLTETAKLEKEQEKLQAERDALQTQISELQATVVLERKISGIRENIDRLRNYIANEETYCVLYHSAAQGIKETLANDGSEEQIHFVEEAIAQSTDETLKIVLIAIRYVANPTQEGRRRLLQAFESASDNVGPNFWDNFGMVPWNFIENDWSVAFEAWQAILVLARNRDLDDQNFAHIALGFHSGHSFEMQDVFSDKEVFFYGIWRARKLIGSDTLGGPSKARGFEVLAALYPDAFMVWAAQNLDDAKLDTYVRNRIILSLQEAKGSFLNALDDRRFPRQVNGDWQGWLRDNAELARVWSSDDLAEARERHLNLSGPSPYR